jgi:hypothetical protein
MNLPESLIGIPYDVNAGPLSISELEKIQRLEISNCQRLFQFTAFQLYGISLSIEACLSKEGSDNPDYHYSNTNEAAIASLSIGDPVYWVNMNFKYPNGFPSFRYKLHITPLLNNLTFLHTTNPEGSRIYTLTQMLDAGYDYYCANTITSLMKRYPVS